MRFQFVALLVMAALPVWKAAGADFVWTASSSGDWNVAGNWTPNQVPGQLDHVTINTSVNVNVPTPQSVSNLDIGTGNLIGPGTLTVFGTMNWSNGMVSCALELSTNSVLNWLGGDLDNVLTVDATAKVMITNTSSSINLGEHNYNFGITNATIVVNNGSITWSNAQILGWGATIQNGGTWQDIGAGTLLVETGSNFFVNAGSYEKSINPNASSINWFFNTTGTVNTPGGPLTVAEWSGSNVLNGMASLNIPKLDAPLTVASNAVLIWLTGDLDDTLTVDEGGTLYVTNAASSVSLGLHNFNFNLPIATALLNNGTVVWGNTQMLGYGATIQNGGLWEDAAESSLLVESGTNVFINTGTLEKTTGTGNATINWLVTSTGAINTLSGGWVMNWAGASTLHGNLNWAGGTLLGSMTVAGDGDLAWSGGTVEGPVSVSANGTLDWLSGDLNDVMTIGEGGSLVITNTSSAVSLGLHNYNFGLTNAAGIVNNGTVTWGDTQILGYGATIENSNLWNDIGESTISAQTRTNIFFNAGTFQKTAGTGSANIAWFFNTTGTLNTPGGSLTINEWTNGNVLNGVANLNIIKLDAPLTVASNAVLNWLTGDIDDTLAIAPGGTLLITNTATAVSFGLHNYNSSSSKPTTLVNNGTVTWGDCQLLGYGASIQNAGLWQDVGESTVSVQADTNVFVNAGIFQKTAGTGSATINWAFNTTGTLNTSSGSLTIGGWTNNSTLNGTANLNINHLDAPLTVAGNAVLNWLTGDLDNTLTIAPGGTLEITNNTSAVNLGLFNNNHGLNGQTVLANNGTVLWGNTQILGYGATIQNAGVWQDLGDGTISDQARTNTFINSGTLQKTNDAGTATIAWPFNTSGSINVQNGVLALTSTTGATQNGGLTLVDGGNISFSKPLQMTGGILSGTTSILGTVTNSGGVVNPGAPFGTLTITGNYVQTSGGTLQIELGGASSNSYNQLNVTGASQIGGALTVSLTNGFTPATDFDFNILTAHPLAGTFDTFSFPPNIIEIQVLYSSTTASLKLPRFGPYVQNGIFTAHFAGLPGTNYTIEYSPALSPAYWQKLSNAVAPTINLGYGIGVFQLDDPVTSSNRFYRTVTPAY